MYIVITIRDYSQHQLTPPPSSSTAKERQPEKDIQLKPVDIYNSFDRYPPSERPNLINLGHWIVVSLDLFVTSK